MGQCQQCQQTLLSDTVNCANGPEGPEDTEAENDFIVHKDTGGYSGHTDTGLLAVWKWDEKPGEGRSNGFQDCEVDAPWPERRDAMATLVLARHLLFNPHLRYKFNLCYRTERKIGAGTYGDVYEATAIPKIRGQVTADTSGEDDAALRRVAVKAFIVEVQSGSNPQDEAEVEPTVDRQKLSEFARRRASFEAERSVLAQIEHPHIVKMHECFEEKGCLYIVLELCRGGELYERIAQKVMAQGGKGFEENVARHLFRQMLYAVGYLHANRVVHRDIKTENFLLLGESGSDDADVLKLCDFGTAVRLSTQRPRSNGRVGTLSYMAPEVYANRGADICADVWSLGVVLYLILVGANPFRNSQTKTKVATVRKIESGDFDQGRLGWLDLTEDARNLIKNLLVLEEEKRLTCVQSLRHHWVERQDGGATIIKNGVQRAALPTPRVDAEQDPAAHASSVLMLLMRFASLDPMQKVVLAACSQTISDKAFKSRPLPIPWYSLFVILDENGDGRIGFDEFASGMKTLLGDEQVPDAKLHSLARALDTDGSGAIEWGEWLAVGLLTVENLCEAPEPLGTAFRLLDRPTGDGTVGAADLLAVVDGGVAGGEFRMPADAARAQVLAALAQYSKKPETETPVTGVASMAPPSLVEDDIRRVLQSINAR
mmetsp:Transcript_66830/g.105719  ORF Transcript_66830/g.105719 Transcript_66830/m.105719 type:complete len:657 (-) Transcript_66830:87-2057(-)